MGIISGMKAVSAIQRLKKGSVENLSIAQISNVIVNLPDASKNLSPKEFDGVHSLYKELQKCTTKMPVDLEGYFDLCVKIIKKFDAIAPYEKYSGGNELEFSFLMDEIRKDSCYDDPKSCDITSKAKTSEDYLKSMNFLEAHKLVHQYIDFIAEDQAKYMPYAIPETALPFYHENWQITLIKASKIFVAYYLLWGNSKEYLDTYYFILKNISSFVPESEASKYSDVLEILKTDPDNKDRLNRAISKVGFPFAESYSIDDVYDFHNEMLDFKRNSNSKNLSGAEFTDFVFEYCCKAYDLANVPYINGYDLFFYSINDLRKFAVDDRFKQHFKGYERYLDRFAL